MKVHVGFDILENIFHILQTRLICLAQLMYQSAEEDSTRLIVGVASRIFQPTCKLPFLYLRKKFGQSGF